MPALAETVRTLWRTGSAWLDLLEWTAIAAKVLEWLLVALVGLAMWQRIQAIRNSR